MFKNSHFGLDISDESIKFVELISTRSGIQLSKYGEYKLLPDIIESGKIKEIEQFEKILSTIKKGIGLKSTHVSLPTELGQNMQIKNYISVFKNSKISVSNFEHEAKALARAVIKKGDPETYMLINFRDKSASIFIISNRMVMFSSVIDADEETLTEKISKHFLYWHTHKNPSRLGEAGEQGKNHPPITKIILSGENSNLLKLSEHLSIKLRHPIELANVWINILDTEKNIPEMSFTESLSFAVALGAALENVK